MLDNLLKSKQPIVATGIFVHFVDSSKENWNKHTHATISIKLGNNKYYTYNHISQFIDIQEGITCLKI
jgi:hypothetical protein